MRNILKKALCLCLALCMAASLGACYSADKTWAAKHGDDVMPIGAYIYYLSSAYTDATDRVSANDKVLEGTIDGQSATDWMKDRALNYIGAYYFLCDKFDELGLTMTDTDWDAVDTGASSYWSYYKTAMENMGISEESFTKAYAEHNVRGRLVMQAMYSEGGEMAVSESELRDYYIDTYDSYEYMYVSKSKNDEDNNSVALTDDELKEMQDTLQGYADQINAGEMTLSEAYTEYSYDSMTTPTHEAPGAIQKDQVHPNISSVLPDMEDNEARTIEVDTGIYVLQKLSVEEYYNSLLVDEDQWLELLTEYRGTEFLEYAMEQGKALTGVEVNQKALDSISVDQVITNKDATGASVPPSASSDDDSDEDSDSSEAESETE